MLETEMRKRNVGEASLTLLASVKIGPTGTCWRSYSRSFALLPIIGFTVEIFGFRLVGFRFSDPCLWLVSNAFRFLGHFDLRKFNHRGTARLTAATNEDG